MSRRYSMRVAVSSRSEPNVSMMIPVTMSNRITPRKRKNTSPNSTRSAYTSPFSYVTASIEESEMSPDRMPWSSVLVKQLNRFVHVKTSDLNEMVPLIMPSWPTPPAKAMSSDHVIICWPKKYMPNAEKIKMTKIMKTNTVTRSAMGITTALITFCRRSDSVTRSSSGSVRK